MADGARIARRAKKMIKRVKKVIMIDERVKLGRSSRESKLSVAESKW
jgi:hypothetical protein